MLLLLPPPLLLLYKPLACSNKYSLLVLPEAHLSIYVFCKWCVQSVTFKKNATIRSYANDQFPSYKLSHSLLKP